MNISNNLTVQNITDQFNIAFPYLRLEFYHHAHDENHGSTKSDQVNHHTLLGQLNPALQDDDLVLDPGMTVAEFENLMNEKFQLHVQVFRKSADLWLQTTATDHWSLEKQNGKGQRSGEEHNIAPIDIRDFDVE